MTELGEPVQPGLRSCRRQGRHATLAPARCWREWGQHLGVHRQIATAPTPSKKELEKINDFRNVP